MSNHIIVSINRSRFDVQVWLAMVFVVSDGTWRLVFCVVPRRWTQCACQAAVLEWPETRALFYSV